MGINKSENWPLPFGPKFDRDAYLSAFRAFAEILAESLPIEMKYNISLAPGATLIEFCVIDYIHNELGSNEHDNTESRKRYGKIMLNRYPTLFEDERYISKTKKFNILFDRYSVRSNARELFSSTDFLSQPHMQFILFLQNDAIMKAFSELLEAYFNESW